jgi:hypothetical protein
MKPDPAKKPKKSTTPAPSEPTPIGIGPEEGERLRKAAARTCTDVATFVRRLILEGVAKLQDEYLTAIPCPFCNQTEHLEIIDWSNERPDGTEYDGDAVRCNQCTAIAPVEAWAIRAIQQPAEPLPQ